MKFKKLAAAAICSAALASNAFAAEMTSDDKKIYFGVEGGYSMGAKGTHTKFKETVQGVPVTGTLTGTGIYEGKVGYKFYPGFSVEVAYGYRPSYGLKLGLADQANAFTSNPQLAGVPGIGGITNISSKTKVLSHTIMLNLVYEVQNEKKYRPYFLFGAGYANVTSKKAPVYGTVTPTAASIPALGYNGNTRPQIGIIKKHTSQRFGWRVGGGMMYDVTPNVALVGGVKLEYIYKIGLHTEFYKPDGSIAKISSLKKSIGVVDFTVGTRISL